VKRLQHHELQQQELQHNEMHDNSTSEAAAECTTAAQEVAPKEEQQAP